MSTFIVAIIIVLLMALAAYAFISQSIEKKRVQRQRVLMALKTKHRNFVHMINGFPPNFLTADLLGLIYRALIDTCEQLSKIEPKEQHHVDDITLYTNQLGALPKTNPAQRPRIENPQIMKDIRQHLHELQHFLLSRIGRSGGSEFLLHVHQSSEEHGGNEERIRPRKIVNPECERCLV